MKKSTVNFTFPYIFSGLVRNVPYFRWRFLWFLEGTFKRKKKGDNRTSTGTVVIEEKEEDRGFTIRSVLFLNLTLVEIRY